MLKEVTSCLSIIFGWEMGYLWQKMGRLCMTMKKYTHTTIENSFKLNTKYEKKHTHFGPHLNLRSQLRCRIYLFVIMGQRKREKQSF